MQLTDESAKTIERKFLPGILAFCTIFPDLERKKNIVQKKNNKNRNCFLIQYYYKVNYLYKLIIIIIYLAFNVIIYLFLLFIIILYSLFIIIIYSVFIIINFIA